MNDSLAKARQSFKNPDVWHLPATYWFWHTIPDKEQIDSQLRQLQAGGYGSFQIAARLSLPLESYLSEEWLAACRYTADKAAGMGLMMGIYDDYNWLSGHAGGRTVEGRDELRERHLFWSQSSLSADMLTCRLSGIRSADAEALQQCGMEWIFADGKPEWDEWEIVAAYATSSSDQCRAEEIVDVSSLARITRATTGEFEVTFKGSELPWGADSIVTLFTAARCRTSRMINYLMPEAAENFIRVGYEPYARAFGDHFGKTVAYLFFDQPHACFWQWNEQVGSVKSSLMYEKRLIDALQQAPYCLAENLMSLVMDIGSRTARRRCELFSCYSRQAMQAFFGTLSAWAHDQGVKLSGHEVLSHVSSWNFASKIITEDSRCNFAMDYFALDGWRDITAVDSRNSEPQMAAKVGDSVARAHGRKGCIVEQYYARVKPGTHFAAGQWEISLHDIRLQALRHHLLGARQFLMHAFWLRDGEANDEVLTNPRFDFAPGINFQPWYAFHAGFAYESGRLAEFLEQGNPYVDVGVLYPKRTFWYCGVEGNEGQLGEYWAKQLSAQGVEYFFIDEENLLQADGTRINGMNFPALLLADVKVVQSAATLSQLERFVAAGGRLLVDGELVAYSEEKGKDCSLTERLQKLIGTQPACSMLADMLKSDRPFVDYPSRKTAVWTRITQDETSRYVTVFNDGETPLYGWLHFPGLCGQLAEWHLATGDISILEEQLAESFPLKIDPWQARCFSLQIAENGHDVVLDKHWQLLVDNVSRPVDVTKGWEQQGMEAWCGPGRYQLRFALETVTDDIQLYLPEVQGSVAIWLNDKLIAEKGWPEYRFTLPQSLLKKSNELAVVVYPSAANHYYFASAWQGEGQDRCGLTMPPRLRTRDSVAVIAG
ncbi:hypothetical protein D7Y87_20925 [Salmonella enterica]|uniref:Glycoside hydrolase family 2 n=3 Tax=Salmonella enterica TaxID=28901 RepID=A0A8E9U0Q4_SALER|nr:hypothetical protein [Salmonella enterica subsp. enterica serovar Orientalis]EAB8343676.1 hypothetical protein [Salmonella enterica subsp. enterica serovar Abaetetuba]EAB9082960.1 hypothetical protein [Salmonella enterica subsp. enterica]EAM3196490.1 hypothetical protein [Salmonella enterica]EAW2069928.1 hypothetical protein [Salmonella enterica subsp. diarizonae]EBS0278434.1 hypothetical protein [Salmonella enterica subsp. enterica serovar Waycross]EBU9774790.1 hypothetical protein [Salmo